MLLVHNEDLCMHRSVTSAALKWGDPDVTCPTKNLFIITGMSFQKKCPEGKQAHEEGAEKKGKFTAITACGGLGNAQFHLCQQY